MRMSVPVPTAELLDLTVRTDDRLDARYTIPTGFAPAGELRWIELGFARGKPWLLGPLSAANAATLVLAFRAWRAEHPIDREPVEVEERELLADPSRWHQRRIAVTGTWHYMFERSWFAKAWLDVPDGEAFSYGTYRLRVVGTWIYPDATAEDGYGHMGCSPGMLRPETIDIIEAPAAALASRDGLTGLLKRAALGDIFRNELRSAERDGRAHAFALIDFDHFKKINDAYGHEAGDEVLRRCSTAIVEALRPGDIVARWGGEEIAVILPGATLAIARAAHVIGMTFSAGVVEIAPGETLGQVSVRADEALYEAKRAGRDRVVAG
jgi:GGDEF domain-containing protein